MSGYKSNKQKREELKAKKDKTPAYQSGNHSFYSSKSDKAKAREVVGKSFGPTPR